MNLERIIEEFHQGHSLNAYELFGAHFVDGSLDHLQTGMKIKS